MGRWLATKLDRLLDWLAPVDTSQWADELADWEADIDTWEPNTPPWQRHSTDRDELWAAEQRHPAGKKLRTEQTIDDYVITNRHNLWPVPETPTGAGMVVSSTTPGHAAASAPGAGGFSDEGREWPDGIEGNIARAAANVLRDAGVRWPNVTGEIVARELLHHFDVRPK